MWKNEERDQRRTCSSSASSVVWTASVLSSSGWFSGSDGPALFPARLQSSEDERVKADLRRASGVRITVTRSFQLSAKQSRHSSSASPRTAAAETRTRAETSQFVHHFYSSGLLPFIPTPETEWERSIKQLWWEGTGRRRGEGFPSFKEFRAGL